VREFREFLFDRAFAPHRAEPTQVGEQIPEMLNRDLAGWEEPLSQIGTERRLVLPFIADEPEALTPFSCKDCATKALDVGAYLGRHLG